MMPNGKLCRPAVNKWLVVSALVVGYVHSNSKPSVANIQLPPWPMRWCWVNQLAFVTISYHNPHHRFRNCRINLNKVQCSPYARMVASVQWFSCLSDEINPLPCSHLLAQHQVLLNLCAVYPSPYATSSHHPQQLHWALGTLRWPRTCIDPNIELSTANTPLSSYGVILLLKKHRSPCCPNLSSCSLLSF